MYFFQDLLPAKNRSLWKFMVVLCFSLIGFLAYLAYGEYLNEKNKTLQELADMNSLLAVHSKNTFEKINIILKYAEDAFSLSDTSKSNAKIMNKILFNMKGIMPELDGIAVTNSSGLILHSSNWYKDDFLELKHEPTYLVDRPYFKKHQTELSSNTFISEPVYSKTTGNLVIIFSRKLPLKNGKFNGVIVASVNLQALSNLYDHITANRTDKDLTISLFNYNRTLLARAPFIKDQVGKNYPNAMPFLNNPEAVDESGNFIAENSAIDHVKKIFSYIIMPDLPVIIVIGKKFDSITKSWWSHQGIFILILILIIFFIIIGMSFYLKKLNENEKQKEIAINSSKMSMLGEMAAGIAHEIINPLAVIKLHSNSVIAAINSEKYEIEKIKISASKIDNMCIRIDKIIRGLKSYSRDSSQDPKVPTALNTMIESAIELTAIRFKNNQVDLVTEECPNVLIFCREAQISQVLINLMNNSSDAISSLPEKWVHLNYLIVDKTIQIIITDSGKGIPHEIAAKLMTPFFTTKELNKGTGLGLSISKKIIEDHGGTLVLDAAYKNTRFIITLPGEKLN